VSNQEPRRLVVLFEETRGRCNVRDVGREIGVGEVAFIVADDADLYEVPKRMKADGFIWK
jgi:hypothetical protein